MPEFFNDFMPLLFGLAMGLVIFRLVIRWIEAPMKNSWDERKPSRVGHIIRELVSPTMEEKQ